MRDYNDEMLEIARIKQTADERIHRRINTGFQAVSMAYGAIFAIVVLTAWLFTIRYDLTREKEDRGKDRVLLNQLYKKVFGFEI